MLIHSKIDILLRFATVAFLAAAVSGCSADSEIESVETAPDGAVLRLSTGPSVSRADDPYDGKTDPYAEGEEAIAGVSLFFFSEDPRSAEKAGDEPFYVYTVPASLGAVTTADLTVKVPVEMIPMFTDDEAYVHVLANLPDITVDDEKKLIGGNKITYKQLQEVWTTEDGFAAKGVPGTFVMQGGAMVSLQKAGDKLAWVKGSVMLKRLASKMRIMVQIPPAIYLDEQGKTIPYLYDDDNRRESEAAYEERVRDIAAEKWEPVPTSGTDSNIRLYLYNIATRGRMDAYTGSPEERDDTGSDSGGILRYRDVDRKPENEEAVRLLVKNPATLNAADISSDYPYTHATAYYSYPNEWNSLSPTEKHQTYVLLSMPWERTASKENTGAEYQVCYYKIPVNVLVGGTDGAKADRLDPNRYYRVKIRLGMLGSKDLGDPLEISASCEVADWTTAGVDVSIKPRRYLVVNQKEWTMNNVSSIDIPFSSSHDVVAECYVTYFRYNDIWGDDSDNTDTSEKHDRSEFDDWWKLADKNKIKDSEGEITSEKALAWGTTGQTLRQMLYYKKEYFYDEYYALPEMENNGFRYYVGHEHPKTFQKTIVARPPQGLPQDGWDEFETKYGMKAVYACKVDNEAQMITFDHPLVWWKEACSDGTYYYVPEMKNGRLRDEYSRCEIIIKLCHADRPEEEHLFEQTIHITQYPGLYIEVSHDYGNKVTGSGGDTEGNEYVFVNGHTTETDGLPTHWNEVSSYIPYFGFINMNPNMYVIHTTQLSEEYNGQYIIGDPRSLYYNNQLGSNERGVNERLHDTYDVDNKNNYWNWYSEYLARRTENIVYAPRLYDADNAGKGYLKYHYPTDETEGNGTKERFVAPVFRVASSFGKVSLSYSWLQGLMGSNTLDIESGKEARRRCAVYQEAGRPAGRWRMPTIAEIEYVMQLSVDQKIPHLFGQENKDNELYWCSTGLLGINLVDIDTNPTVEGRIIKYASDYDMDQDPAVRCVYDDWYWNMIDEQDGNMPYPLDRTFRWGDRRKDNVQTRAIMHRAINQKEIVAEND